MTEVLLPSQVPKLASSSTPLNVTSTAPGSQHGSPAYIRADFPSGNAPDIPAANESGRSYTILKEVGDGSFGTVWLADWHSPLTLPPGTRPPGPSSRPEYTGKNLVAIKRMKKAFNGGWEECMRLKELKSLRAISSHPNIIPLYDAFLMPSSKELYFVFECMEGNLYQLTKSRKMRPLASGLVATIFFQMLGGLHHIHQSGFFHRDMKPENVLITTTGLADYPNGSPARPHNAPPERDVTVIVKLADFGLARETHSKPPYTEYVSTRWYRAPEVLLRDREYSNPVDMWALGTILAEMVTLKPLFPGGTEVDQVHRICEVLGDPSDRYSHTNGTPMGGGPWFRGVRLARLVHFEFQPMPPIDFRALFDLRIVPLHFIDCIFLLLRFDPLLRLTTGQCLQHPYFTDIASRLRPLPAGSHIHPLPPTPNSATYVAPSYLPSAQAGMLSPPHSQQGGIDDIGGRSLPPSHSHGTPAPRPEYARIAHNGGHRSAASTASSQKSLDSMPLYHSGAVDSQLGSHRQSFPQSIYSEATWPSPLEANQFVAGPLPVPAFRQPRLSTAASTFYDGSIFEGIAPTREASIMSFNMYGEHETAASRYAAAYQQQQEDKHHQARSRSTFPVASSSRSFYEDDAAASAVRSTGLKRTTSERSQTVADAQVTQQPPKDPKKAKKEAEKAAKEAERAKREAAQRAARERARAVMQKKTQLEQKAASGTAADPLNILRPAPKAAELLVDKVKPRGTPLPHIAEHDFASSTQAPNIVFHTGGRFKARRRDDDDDVHSVSSNETRNSHERGRSAGTVDSDPVAANRPNWPFYHPHLAKGYPSHNHVHTVPPGSSSSSVDDRLAKTFQGLTAAEHGRSEAATISPASSGFPGGSGSYFESQGQTHLPFLPREDPVSFQLTGALLDETMSEMQFAPEPNKTLPSYQLDRHSSHQQR